MFWVLFWGLLVCLFVCILPVSSFINQLNKLFGSYAFYICLSHDLPLFKGKFLTGVRSHDSVYDRGLVVTAGHLRQMRFLAPRGMLGWGQCSRHGC